MGSRFGDARVFPGSNWPHPGAGRDGAPLVRQHRVGWRSGRIKAFSNERSRQINSPSEKQDESITNYDL